MAGRARNSPYGVGYERGGEIGAYHDVYGGPPRYAAPSFVSHQEQHDFGEVNPFCSNGEEDDPSMFGVGDRNGFVAYSGVFYDPSPSAPPIHHASPSDFHHQPWSLGDGRVNQTTFSATSANPPVHNFPSSSSNAYSRKPLEQLKTHQTDGKHGRNSYVNGSYVFDNTDSEDTLTRTSTSFPISRPKGANNMFESNHSSYSDNGRKTKLVEENSPKKASLKDHVKNHMGLFRTSSKIHSGRNDGPSRFFSPKRQQRPPHDNSSNMEFRRSSISVKSQQNVDFANEIFVTINEISLLTEPTKCPPPSRPPPSITTKLPKFSENKRYNRSQSGNAIEQSQNQDDHNFIYSGYEAQTGVKINSHILRSPENGVPVATSTTAAMKDAVKRAEGRSKSVNEGSENHYPDREKKAKKFQTGKQAKVETVMHNKSYEDAMWTKISSENHKPSLSMPESYEELHDSSKICETEEPIVYDQKEEKSVQEKVRKEKQSYVEVSGTRNVYPGKEREHEDFEKPTELPTQDVWNKAQRVMVEKAVIEARKRALAQAREAAAAQIKERAAAEIAEALECTHKIAEERTANVAEMKERATRGKTEREAKEPAPVSSRQHPERLAKQRPFKDEKVPVAKVTKEHAAAEKAAVEKITSEVRLRAAVEAKARAEAGRTGAGIWETVVDKSSVAKEHAAAEKAAVEKITSEVRLRAAAEAKARAEAGRTGAGIWETVVDKSSVAKEHAAAEKAAVEKITSEVRLRAAAEAKARVEAGRTGAGIWETVDDKSSIRRAAEARIKAERAAVERVHIEARQRAAKKAAAEKAANEAKERAERAATGAQKERKENFEDDLEAFFEATFRAESAPRERTPMTNSTAKPKFKNSESANEPQGASPVTTTANDLTSLFTFEAASAEGDFQEIIGEPPERRKARFEQHQRIAERAAKAIAEKNNRDLQMQREQAERNRISDTLDAEIKRWAAGKQGNLRALLSTLQYVLWSDSGWQSLSLIDLNSPASVKKAYRRAALCVHPDKVQQKGANIQQKYIAEKVFDLLKDAWNKFNAEELS